MTRAWNFVFFFFLFGVENKKRCRGKKKGKVMQEEKPLARRGLARPCRQLLQRGIRAEHSSVRLYIWWGISHNIRPALALWPSSHSRRAGQCSNRPSRSMRCSRCVCVCVVQGSHLGFVLRDGKRDKKATTFRLLCANFHVPYLMAHAMPSSSWH